MEKFFKVSSKLKQIIGRDLITNDFVAVFELVKNSFDAHATHVDIFFEPDRILIVDNGKGMTESALQEKWLFVAYSAKSDGSEDDDLSKDYRTKIRGANTPAGNKGVGRFSCDRLGSELILKTRSERDQGAKTHVLKIDWDKFEADPKNEFIKIAVDLTHQKTFDTPKGARLSPHGTILEIETLREEWDRQKLLLLKLQLAKLITPFESRERSFAIVFHAKKESAADLEVKRKIRATTDEIEKEKLALEIVNGPVANSIFGTLLEKTTSIKVSILANGVIETQLVDRGEEIYRIQEPNVYLELADTNFTCQLYYLNLAAKLTFARRMGIESANFGSVFLFRNGFRVFPVGEVDDDTFGINTRKQQGYARYLGTRELLGHISVEGKESKFREASSRDQGLIKTKAYQALLKCFRTHCFRRLERYVVDVTWQDPLDKDRDTIKGLLQKQSTKSSVIKIVSALANTEDIVLLSYSKNLVQILDRKSDGFEESLKRLEAVASKTKDKRLTEEVRAASERFEALKAVAREAEEKAKREETSRKLAEKAKEKATKEAVLQATRADTAEVALKEETKRSLFLEAHVAADVGSLLEWFHQIDIYSADMDSGLGQLFKQLKRGADADVELMKEIVEDVFVKNQKILQVSRLVTKANFRLNSETIDADIVGYIDEYVSNISRVYQLRVGERFRTIQVDRNNAEFVCKFKPMEVGMAIDNIISNSRRNKARRLEINFSQSNKKTLLIDLIDDGDGLASSVEDVRRLFERGYTTTTGAGLGLTLVKRVFADQLKGELEVDATYIGGFKLIVRLAK